VPRKAAGLSAAKVRTATPGRYGDGNGLYLLVRSAEAKFWVFRYVLRGRMREMGLGPAAGSGAVLLVDARVKARRLHDMVREGRDPLNERAAAEAAAKAAAQRAEVRGKTFRDVAELYLAAHEAGWRNAKHRQQWENTLRDYAHPHLGDLRVAEADTAHVMAALEPIWRTKSETASRLRGRIEAVLDYAKARGWRTGENPARWRGHLANLLPARAKMVSVEHHAALPWSEIGAFMAELRQQNGVSARALEFAILTAARSGEVIGARWSEVDSTGIWTVPADRMKVGKEHRVPLSGPALDLLDGMARLRTDHARAAHVFPGKKPGRSLNVTAFLLTLRRMGRGDLTAHGFRSSFRDWCAEATSYPREVAEAALAHSVESKAEAAYRRGDLFEKRRRLMEEWGEFCGHLPTSTAEVVRLRRV
jgi:integrase